MFGIKIINRGKKSKGFTLLELLVVIIIVGVLASVAMPALFRNVERSRSAEALTILGMIWRAYGVCRMMEDPSPGYTNCTDWDKIGMDNPTNAPGSHFTYNFLNGSGVGFLTATRNTVDSGDNSSRIEYTWTVSFTTGLTKTGSGVFQGMQF